MKELSYTKIEKIYLFKEDISKAKNENDIKRLESSILAYFKVDSIGPALKAYQVSLGLTYSDNDLTYDKEVLISFLDGLLSDDVNNRVNLIIELIGEGKKAIKDNNKDSIYDFIYKTYGIFHDAIEFNDEIKLIGSRTDSRKPIYLANATNANIAIECLKNYGMSLMEEGNNKSDNSNNLSQTQFVINNHNDSHNTSSSNNEVNSGEEKKKDNKIVWNILVPIFTAVVAAIIMFFITKYWL